MKVLLVEDSAELRSSLRLVLSHEGFEVIDFSSGEEALRSELFSECDIIVSDHCLPGLKGTELLHKMRSKGIDCPALLMTAFGTMELAVEAFRSGANEFISKPFEIPTFLRMIRELLERHEHTQRRLPPRGEMIFTSKAMGDVVDFARKVSRVDSTVLLFGESGTGKELLARFIHAQSPRGRNPFVAVNCAALPLELLESEFFGHEAGAFTGAQGMRRGLLEVASEGTLFLDEIGDMPKSLQVKLLRALQEREIFRVGGTTPIRINPRIVAATNLEESDLLGGGNMREDLYYRLAVITITLPPLRNRAEDIPVLVEWYASYFAERFGRTKPAIPDEVMGLLRRYPWPGNVRELKHSLERAVVLAEDALTVKDLGIDLVFDELMQSLSLQRVSELAAKTAEIEAIMRTLAYTEGNKSEAARLLGVSYKTLLHKVQAWGLSAHL